MINRSQKFIFYEFSYRLLGITTEHLKTQPHLVLIKNNFYYPFQKRVEKVEKSCMW